LQQTGEEKETGTPRREERRGARGVELRASTLDMSTCNVRACRPQSIERVGAAL
jgi:hypothetical protein